MIITVVCDVLGEEKDGTNVATMNLVRYLKSQGHTVRILCADQTKIGEENYYIVPRANLWKAIDSYVERAGAKFAKPDVNVIKSALDGADHLHVMLPFSLGNKTASIAKQMGMSITAGFHMQAENFSCYFKMNKSKLVNNIIYRHIWRTLYKNVDGIHYPTEFIRDQFESNIHKNTNGFVISNGTHDYVKKYDVEKPEEYKDKILLLSIGRFSREKSQDTLIKAVKYSKYKDKIQILLAGRGVKEKYYKKLGKKLPNEPVMKFLGRTEVVDAINYCDLYVHPADVELEGIACLEAMVCQKLTIVSNSKKSATRKFVADRKCIFKSRKPKDLARVIDFWLDNPELRKSVEDEYKNYGEIYSHTKCMKQMENMIFEVHNNKIMENNSMLLIKTVRKSN